MRLRDRIFKQKKTSGILLSITSLPSKYGIGSLGEEAFRFIDFLKKSNQTYWQILPLCPIGKGNSPYYSPSTFAGEILLIDIDLLVSNGLLCEDEICSKDFSKNVDYETVREYKIPLLKKAVDRFDKESRSFLRFKELNNHWLEDYALFMAVKDHFSGASFEDWDDSLKYRMPEALEEFKISHQEEISFYEITQYLFFEQYFRLKSYANSNGIKIIGDIPFYVSLESADVWSNPDCFRLGRDMTPVLVAGVPPDLFSEDGQLWGNPIYDWDYQKKNDFLWWKRRLSHCAGLYDVIRIDHFRAFADYYTIPFGAKTAKGGKWEKGMGIGFWKSMSEAISGVQIIAEDLGGDTDEVAELVKQTGFPNMKVLQFGFSGDLKNTYLPKNFSRNCVCYTGTHDNDTTVGWYEKATDKEKLLFSRITANEDYSSPSHKMISIGMKSKAQIVIIPIQDYMSLGSNHRLNVPGTATGNWEWRLEKDNLNDNLCKEVLELTSHRN